MIPFNKPHLTGKETQYIEEAVKSGKISGNGIFTQKCQSFFEEKYKFKKALLTTSCTDALEMAAMLANIGTADEVIIPSYTFVSTALAFVRQGAKIIFADSYKDNPNIDAAKIEGLITPKTKAIVVVHYAGIACDMEKIMDIAERHQLIVIEDAAQAIDSFYTFSDGRKKALGSIGHFGAFSFHETKNIISGEGGMLTINDEQYIDRAEVIWEKGTNRSQFFRGEINKYGWVDTGSSFLPSEIISAFLWAQLENLEKIQKRRLQIWNQYSENLKNIPSVKTPQISDYATNNAHMFYLIFENIDDRSNMIKYLKDNGVLSVFHYLSLHKSDYYSDKHDGRNLQNSDNFENTLLRLPMYYDLSESEIDRIVSLIKNYFN
ncbi:dTDP-4-amino-4,6-dideoxygalactose transaminase [Chryseobacterium piscicola]|uniref:dTDP-4-amino-4,6-dideoxygalactose transaminase n=1 Tax=Chryseobacterium piscicola TaxID=551459 RepID=A0A1N7KDZ0_9FLAO|nr:dTDP-4-amino-4,6-dideoxygalactose transaminase [Chryseobacterium piscicola]PQA96356.1 dTDP-4-amino-4,6-dideoxygalactose transaminase [Chryseobacterium piscicola]SIS59769.1 dTDP-4-amino-4,6-dideoxygalactose transaminase [Chryseobacterium piscicola]